MNLHNNEKDFISLIRIVSEYYKIDPAFVEKVRKQYNKTYKTL